MVGNGRFRKFYKSTKISKSGALGGRLRERKLLPCPQGARSHQNLHWCLRSKSSRRNPFKCNTHLRKKTYYLHCWCLNMVKPCRSMVFRFWLVKSLQRNIIPLYPFTISFTPHNHHFFSPSKQTTMLQNLLFTDIYI